MACVKKVEERQLLSSGSRNLVERGAEKHVAVAGSHLFLGLISVQPLIVHKISSGCGGKGRGEVEGQGWPPKAAEQFSESLVPV